MARALTAIIKLGWRNSENNHTRLFFFAERKIYKKKSAIKGESACFYFGIAVPMDKVTVKVMEAEICLLFSVIPLGLTAGQ